MLATRALALKRLGDDSRRAPPSTVLRTPHPRPLHRDAYDACSNTQKPCVTNAILRTHQSLIISGIKRALRWRRPPRHRDAVGRAKPDRASSMTQIIRRIANPRTTAGVYLEPLIAERLPSQRVGTNVHSLQLRRSLWRDDAEAAPNLFDRVFGKLPQNGDANIRTRMPSKLLEIVVDQYNFIPTETHHSGHRSEHGLPIT